MDRFIRPWAPLRALGFYEVDGRGLRGRWFDVYLRWSLGVQYSVYHDSAHLALGLIFVQLYIRLPVFITERQGTEDWNASYGFCIFGRSVHLYWRCRFASLAFPWDWEHVRHSYYWPDGVLHHHAGSGEFQPPAETQELLPYTYVGDGGEIQQRFATVNGEEREWRWRWFTWLPWPRRISRNINVKFSAEVGEGTGSWKGGCCGCGWDWRRGESLEHALRRMERERRFTR